MGKRRPKSIWVDLRWDNLGLIWIIWGCKYGIMQSGAIVIIRATRHAEGASQKAGPPRKLRPPKKIEASRPDKRNMRRRPHYSDALVKVCKVCELEAMLLPHSLSVSCLSRERP